LGINPYLIRRVVLMPELIIAGLLIAAAGYIFYKNFKKSASGECNCGSCSTSCPKYDMVKEKKQD
jgi:hypothetical protein